MIWIIFIKILKNTIQIKNKKCWSYLMIWLLIYSLIKKLYPIVTELYIRGRKSNISLVFITQSYFAAPKNNRLNSKNIFLLKIPNKRELQKLYLIIHQILTFKTLWVFIKSVLQSCILFWLLILLLHQIIPHVLERIFQKENKS